MPEGTSPPDDLGVSAQPTPGANELKRRLSETAGPEENKRSRIDTGKTSPTTVEEMEEQNHEQLAVTSNTSPKARDGKRARLRGIDEKQRNKRLFGAVFGDINPPSDRTLQRRAQTEQRKKAELKRQDDERLADQRKHSERLAIHRQKVQVQVDEQNMRTRHQSMLKTANFLQTEAEPKIYWRPWELLPHQEDQIDDQIRGAQRLIDEEAAEWEQQKRIRLESIEGTTKDKTVELAAQVDNDQMGGDSRQRAGITETADSVAAQAKSTGTDEASQPVDTADADDHMHEGSPHRSKSVADEETLQQANEELKADEQLKVREVHEEEDDEKVVEGDEDNVLY